VGLQQLAVATVPRWVVDRIGPSIDFSFTIARNNPHCEIDSCRLSHSGGAVPASVSHEHHRRSVFSHSGKIDQEIAKLTGKSLAKPTSGPPPKRSCASLRGCIRTASCWGRATGANLLRQWLQAGRCLVARAARRFPRRPALSPSRSRISFTALGRAAHGSRML
jgi:hypothetical protein